MCKNDYSLGGEQSGHIIFKKHLTTGDGLQTALNILQIMKESNKSIIELSDGLKIYPQLLVNVPVRNKEAALHDVEIQAEVRKITDELANNGRILVRPSGTEPLVRVMVEAENDTICHDCVYRVVEIIEKKFQ